MRAMFTGVVLAATVAVVGAAVAGAVTMRNHRAAAQAIAPVLNTWSPVVGTTTEGRHHAAVVNLIDFMEDLNNDLNGALDASRMQSLQSASQSQSKRAWNYYRDNIRPLLSEDVSRLQRNLGPARPFIQDPDAFAKDLQNMQYLLELADDHHDTTGIQALNLCKQVGQDLQYYLMGVGKAYGVSNVQGSQQVDQFLQPYLSELK
jgi:hypothetical protein